MKITIEINKCYECKHSDHSGAFTKGGAIPLCRHEDVSGEHNRYHGRERKRNSDGKIPGWCPLKNGGTY
jgi:hypothetical protein